MKDELYILIVGIVCDERKTNEERENMRVLLDRSAISKVAAVVVAIIIVVAAIAGAAYYMTLPSPSPSSSQVLTIGTTDSPTTLDPGSLVTSAAAWVDTFVLDPLVTYKVGTSELMPWLAKNWTVSEDGKTIDFYLEEGVMWHDGTEFTADDVKFTMDRESFLPGVMNYLITGNLESCEVVSKYHVRLKTFSSMPNVMLKIMTLTLYAPVPMSNIRKTAGNTTAWGADAWGYDVFVGTGPYKLVKYVRDQYIILERNQNFWAKRKGFDPTIENITMKYYGSSAALRMALEKKEIDITWRGLDPVDISSLAANPNIKVEDTIFNTQFFDMHFSPPLDNMKVRQAIAYALNVSDVMERGFKNRGIVGFSFIPPTFGFWYEAAFNVYQYNPEKAKQLLAEAGYPNGSTTTLYLSVMAYPEYMDVATVIKDNLAKVGIEVTLESVDPTEFEHITKSPEIPGCLVYNWWPDYPDPENWLTELIQYIYKGNATIWRSDRFEELGNLAKSENNEDVRKTYYDEMMLILAEDVPIIPLGFTYKTVAHQEYVEGFTLYYSFYQEIFGYGYCHIAPKS